MQHKPHWWWTKPQGRIYQVLLSEVLVALCQKKWFDSNIRCLFGCLQDIMFALRLSLKSEQFSASGRTSQKGAARLYAIFFSVGAVWVFELGRPSSFFSFFSCWPTSLFMFPDFPWSPSIYSQAIVMLATTFWHSVQSDMTRHWGLGNPRFVPIGFRCRSLISKI